MVIQGHRPGILIFQYFRFYKIGADWSSFKITIGNGSVSLYIDNTLIQTVSADTSKFVSVWGGSSSNKVSVRNVVIE